MSPIGGCPASMASPRSGLHTELRVDRENILTFGEAYQSVQTLTIGELWAIPQMLRIAMIEAIQELAAEASRSCGIARSPTSGPTG